MNYYKLYTEMMARGEYDKLERDGQGNMKDRRALLQQGTLDISTEVKNDIIESEELLTHLNRHFSFRNYKDEQNKQNYTYKEIQNIFKDKYTMVTNKITPDGRDRFLVFPKTGQIILCHAFDGIHSDLILYSCLEKIIPPTNQYLGWAYAENARISDTIVAFQMDSQIGDTAFLSESYDFDVVDFIQDQTLLMDKCEEIINKHLSVYRIDFNMEY